ncbi:SRPBCC family protein [Novosphingobium aquimarinum]|uniref:SRPBCC family protein n=1 Tax=Novosphingobium aquimarinum TaxID=2682494 RepID=UPI0012EBF0C5|nr:SRPBCC family protein [Novosphingobium aquimarinum]
MLKCALSALLAFLSFSSPALANVSEASERGFVIRQVAEVPVSAQEAWDVLVEPSRWWNPAHTFSADAANLSLDARAGGCWCEILRNPESPNAAPLGSVEHLRVIYIERARALRLSGALGPLQSDAVVGTLTFQLKSEDGATRILMEYVVAGYMRTPMARMAPAVDGVLADQLSRLADRLGGTLVPTATGMTAPDATADGEGPMPSKSADPAQLPEEATPPAILPIDPDAAAEDAFVPAPIEGR